MSKPEKKKIPRKGIVTTGRVDMKAVLQAIGNKPLYADTKIKKGRGKPP